MTHIKCKDERTNDMLVSTLTSIKSLTAQLEESEKLRKLAQKRIDELCNKLQDAENLLEEWVQYERGQPVDNDELLDETREFLS